MVSRKNVKYKLQQEAKQVPHYGIRKLSIGVASVLLGTVFYMQNGTAHADVNLTVSTGNDSVNVVNKDFGTSGSVVASSTLTGVSSAGSVVSAGDATNFTAPNQALVLPVDGVTKQADNAVLLASEPESATPASQVNVGTDTSNAISSLPPASHHQAVPASNSNEIVNETNQGSVDQYNINSSFAYNDNDRQNQENVFDVNSDVEQSNAVSLEQSNVLLDVAVSNSKQASDITESVSDEPVSSSVRSVDKPLSSPSQPVLQPSSISSQPVFTLLMSFDTAPPQTQAELTVTDSTTGEAFPAETNGNIDTEYHLSTTGQFSVRLGDLLNQQRLKLADVTTTSTSGKFMNFSATTGGFRVEYQDQYLGNLDWDYDQTTGQGSIYLQSALTNSPFSDLSNDAVISINLVKVPSLVSLNWETDPHRFVPLDPDGSFHETLTITSVGTNKQQSLLFKIKPRKFDHENDSMWTNISASSSANNSTFNDYVTPLLDQNTGSIIDQLNSGTANLSLSDDLYTLYYDLKPVGNSKLNLDDFSIYVNKLPNAIGSDGRMTKETLWINGPDFKQLKGQNGITFESAGDNLSFGDLARNDFNGAEWSLQTDGSARIVLKLPKKWLQLTDSDFHQLTDSTITGVFDQNGEEAAESGAKKFYKQLDNMPTRFVVGFWLPYSNDKLHHDNHYDLSRLAVDGSVIYSGNAKQPDSQVDLQGQTQINVHFVNAYDGSDVTTPLSSIGWPSKDKLSIDWVKSLPTGFDYGELRDGKLLNGQNYTLPAGYELLTGQPESIDYPAKNVINYVVIVLPKVETASIKFVDDDDANAKFNSAVVSGYFSQKIVFDNYDALLKALSDRHYKLTGNDFLPGQEIYKLDGNNYTIHLKHQVKQMNDSFDFTRTINLHYPDGSVKITIQSVTIRRQTSKDLVTGVTTNSDWSNREVAAVSFAKLAGYHLDHNVDALTVNADTVKAGQHQQVVDAHYVADPQTLTIHYVDAMGHEVGVSHQVIGVTDQTVNVLYQVPKHYVLLSDMMSQFKLSADSDENQLMVFVAPKVDFRSHVTNAADLNKTVSRTIKIQTPDGQTKNVVQTVKFVRNGYLNQVTKETTYSPWSFNGRYQFSSYQPKAIDGYTVDVAPEISVTPDSSDMMLSLAYHKLVADYSVDYQLVNGTVVKNVSVTPENNGTIHLTAPQGYRLLTSVTDVQVVRGSQKLAVLVAPSEQTYTVHDDLPSDVTEPLTKTVTRMVKIMMPNGHVRTVKQVVKFTRTATVNADGIVKYSNWQALGRAQFNKVFVPKRHGYHLVITDANGKALTAVKKIDHVTAEMNDAVVNVQYVKN